ncbi:hypothetical protein C8Q74DRAFT_1364089 [Fomes fomentarius]|nr:hypothetical protein C8Q74DRAFT_1364089 [Fomes fomentarius]
MAAVRPKLAVLPSGGAAYARSMTESSSAADFLDLKSPESPVAGSMPAKPKGKVSNNTLHTAPSGGRELKRALKQIPQPNVKKMRRRVALLSGVHLNLPNSPVVGPSPPGTARELAWTFTAEWDSTQDEFIFSDLDSSSSSGGSSSGLSSASTRFFRNNPVPCDVNEDDAFSPLAKLSICSRLQELASASASSSSSSSSASSSASTSPSSPAVSDIFDLYTSTPSTHSFSFSDSNDSSSSASSSPVDTSSPSSYTDSQFDPPVISVTFYEDEASQRVTVDRMVVAPASAFEPISWEPLLVQKSRSLPQTPQSAGVPKIRRSRPLPPVPVRTSSRA